MGTQSPFCGHVFVRDQEPELFSFDNAGLHSKETAWEQEVPQVDGQHHRCAKMSFIQAF